MISMLKFYIKFLIVINIFYSVSSTINPRNKYEKNVGYSYSHSNQQLVNVFERGLVEKEPLVRDIIMESNDYFINTTLKKFHGKIMSYVAPWENVGLDVSKIWAKKFDIITPVWFEIQRIGSNSYKFSNQHESFDHNWIKDIRKHGKTKKRNLEVYPRFTFYKFTDDDFTKLFTYNTERQAVNKLIVETCHYNKLDGIVLELWHGLANRVYENHLYNFIIMLADDLKAEGFELILVIPPWDLNRKNLFTSKNFEYLYSHVEYFALKTYEYSTPERPGPNAPLPWMRVSVENIVPSSVENYKMKRKKILMGINLYGYDYTADGRDQINGQEYINLIKNNKNRLIFDDINIENFFSIRKPDGRHMIFYPTLYSINERIKLAEELGVGIALVDLAMGLNYFYDLF